MVSTRVVPQQISSHVGTYLVSLVYYCKAKGLLDLFYGPVDHVALKMGGAQEYDEALTMWLPLSCDAYEITLNGRRIATIILREPASVEELGSFTCLEIMERRPDKEGPEFVGLEHVEVHYPDLDSLARRFDKQRVAYERSDNGHHQTVVLVINDLGQEIKFTNRPLLEVVAEQKKRGEIRALAAA